MEREKGRLDWKGVEGKEVIYRLPSLYLGTESVEEGNERGGERVRVSSSSSLITMMIIPEGL
jgi:hypothetical protein